MQYTTFSLFANDAWKIGRKLTLTLGARVEHLGPWVDRHNNGLATFEPALYAKECSGDGRTCSVDMPGMTWNGQGTGVANSVSKPAMFFISPRVGVSWDVFGSGNTVIRGGWGVYRSEEEFNPYAMAAATAQGFKNSYLTNQLSFDLIDAHTPGNVPDFDAYAISPNDTKRPLHYEYNLTVSQHLPWRSLLEVSYVGSNNKNLSSGATENSDLNLLPMGSLFSNDATFLSTIPTDAGGAAASVGALTTEQEDYFRKYPYYTHIYVINHNFYSNYNSLQLSWNKSSGFIQYGVNYTFSKDLAVAPSYTSELPDPVNIRNDYNPAPYDRTQVFNAHYLIDLGTRYHGHSQVLANVLNGWQISGVSTVQSGAPLASIEGGNFNFYGGSIAATAVPYSDQVEATSRTSCTSTYGIASGLCLLNINNVNWLGTPDVLLMPTVNCNPTAHLHKNQFMNPNCFGVSNVTKNGAYRMPYIHGPAYLNHDLSLLKNFKAGEKRNVQFRLAAFNFLNHPLTSFNKNDTSNLTLGIQNAVPGQALQSAYLQHQNFGVANVKYGFRLLELSVKYEF
jgi:hypothetical protein